MIFEPHPYQTRGIEWIHSHKACGLFLPMGAGKTITTLTAIEQLLWDSFEVSRVLIIGPKRVIETTWPDEIDKWNMLLSYSIIAGTPQQRRAALKANADVYLLGVDNTQWLINEIGKDWPFNLLVVDELSLFKNPQSKRFKALKTVMPAVKRFIGLTGTPTPRGLPDLWSQIYLMDRGERLGKTLTSFRSNYLKPGRTNGYTVYNWLLQPGADKKIQGKISDICMSIDQREYASLPDISYIDQLVDLKGDRAKYRRFKKEMLMEIEDDVILASNAGVLCSKLSQYTSGSIYSEDHKVCRLHNHKLETLKELMASANGNSVLIFYWYQHEVPRIREALRDYTGMDIKEDGAIKALNDGKLDYLLLQPSSAGHGLNLQQNCHIAVWFSLPNWNLELYQQANARIARQGQKEKVLIYHLLAKGTIDMDMMKALENKTTTQQALLDALKKED